MLRLHTLTATVRTGSASGSVRRDYGRPYAYTAHRAGSGPHYHFRTRMNYFTYFPSSGSRAGRTIRRSLSGAASGLYSKDHDFEE